MSERADDDGGGAPRDEAEATARKQREIQSAQDRKDEEKRGGSGHRGDKAVQAGARAYPERLPAQHLRKPGGAQFGQDTAMKRAARPEEFSPAYVFSPRRSARATSRASSCR